MIELKHYREQKEHPAPRSNYRINEIFYSLQGEGLRAGTSNLFIRFSGCNLRCRKEEMGFDCDTEFVSGRGWSLEALSAELNRLAPQCRSVILTGGEPGLQIDEALIQFLKSNSYYIAIETNGTQKLPDGIDWITLSPKTAEHCLRVLQADELKYVRSHGMGLPQPTAKAKHYLISPAFEGDQLPPENLEWCLKLVRDNPPWRLSLQQHKFWNIR